MRGLADEEVHVDGVDSLVVWVLLHHAADGAEHVVHGLAEQIQLARLRGGEIVRADDVDGLAVELLRPEAVGVVHTKTGLDVSHGDLRAEEGEVGAEAGRGVSADKHNIGPLTFEDRLKLQQHVKCHFEQRLLRLHDPRSWHGAMAKTRSIWSSISRC